MQTTQLKAINMLRMFETKVVELIVKPVHELRRTNVGLLVYTSMPSEFAARRQALWRARAKVGLGRAQVAKLIVKPVCMKHVTPK